MKRILSIVLCGCLCFVGNRLSAADRADEMVRRAKGYLIGQQKESGAIADRDTHTAITALAILALLAVGVTPDDPSDEGRALKKALDFVLQPDRQQDDGYFGSKDHSRMYGHGIVTLMLAEIAGMTSDAEQDAIVAKRLEKAIKLILRSQKVEKSAETKGGWRYNPDARDSDMSVTVWQTMALRAAHNAGFEVPREAIDDASAYIRRSFRDVTKKEQDGDEKLGVFLYEPKGNGGRDDRHIPTTAEGLLALQVCGEYDASEVKAATNFLKKYPPTWEMKKWVFYGGYYYAQGMNQHGGRDSEEARRHIVALLSKHQEKDGSWLAPDGTEEKAGRVYATSLAILALAVKDHYLPIYQR